MKTFVGGAKNDTGHICDYCEQDDGRPTIVWLSLPKRKGHFAICYDCVERLYMEFLPVDYRHTVKTVFILRRALISEAVRNEVFKRDGYKCVTCSSEEKLTLDHIIPFSAGGETNPINLQTLCKRCNSKKGSRYRKSATSEIPDTAKVRYLK